MATTPTGSLTCTVAPYRVVSLVWRGGEGLKRGEERCKGGRWGDGKMGRKRMGSNVGNEKGKWRKDDKKEEKENGKKEKGKKKWR